MIKIPLKYFQIKHDFFKHFSQGRKDRMTTLNLHELLLKFDL